MEKKKNPRKKTGSAPSKDTGFDSWLDDKLRTAYSSVLDEPIPDDLIKLVQQTLKD